MIHKLVTTVVLCAASISFIFAQAPKAKPVQLSQAATVTQTVGITDISVLYHRPGVKGRKIWGELEPLGKVWRAGANEATVFSFSNDVTISGTTLKAGRYSFFLIPTDGDWTVIFNSVADQWGAYSYDSTKDVVRFTVKPVEIANEEWLSYSFSDLTVNSATVTMKWEKVAISFTVTTNTEQNVMDYRASAAQQATNYARYMYDSKMDWDKGMASVDRSIAIDRNFGNLSLKAQFYAQKEMWKDAVTIGEEAVMVGKKSGANTTNFEKQLSDWKKKK